MMMRDLSQKDIVDGLLKDWHQWQTGYSPVPVCGSDPMFRNAKSGKGWDSTSEVIQDELYGSTMETIDFVVSQMLDIPQTQPYRSAIYAIARNLRVGCNVWMSPRLPKSAEARAVVIMEARNMLARRLMDAGVL